MKSPNYMSRKGWTPDMIVLHVTEGYYEGAKSWLCNPDSGTSSHFVTARDGRYEQLVDLDKAAWCNGTSTDPNKKYYYNRSTNALVRERKTNANYYSISIENEGFSYKDGYGELSEPQYQTVLKICKELIAKYNIPVDREHIVGHYEIAPKEKPNCPGSKFQWDRLMSDLKGGSSNENTSSNTNTSSNSNNGSSIVKSIQKGYNEKWGGFLGIIDVDGIAGSDTKKHLIKALQYEMNIQYGCKLDVDGSFGLKTKAQFLTLKKGVKGNITWLCQARLYIKGYNPNGLDHIFGNGMETCVKKYQRDKGLTVDGLLGKNTAYSLFN